MALALTLAEKEDLYITLPGETPARFVMTEMFSDEAFTLTRVSTGEQYEIGPEKATEILPGVRVSEGPRVLSSKVRAVFQAALEIKIDRGEVFHAKNG